MDKLGKYVELNAQGVINIEEAVTMTELWRVIGYKIKDSSKNPPSKITIGTITEVYQGNMGKVSKKTSPIVFMPTEMKFKIENGLGGYGSRHIYALFLHHEKHWCNRLELNYDIDALTNWRYILFGLDSWEYDNDEWDVYYFEQLGDIML